MSSEDMKGRVLHAIANGAHSLSDIAKSVRLGPAEDDRSVDRTLQALRKENKISYGGKPARWHLGGAKKTCPTCKGTGLK